MFDPYKKWLGIPPEEQPPNHYRLLGIGLFEKDMDAIRAAVVQRSAYVRNFQAGQHAEHATRILNEIGAAEACLTNAAKRGPYDAELKRKEDKRKAAEAARTKPPPLPPMTPLVSPALEQLASAPGVPLWTPQTKSRGWSTWQVAAIGGGAIVVVLLAVVVVSMLGGGDEPQPVASAGQQDPADGPSTADGGPTGTATDTQSATQPSSQNATASSTATDSTQPDDTAIPPNSTSTADTTTTDTTAEAAAPTDSAEPEVVVYLDTLRPFGVLAMHPETGEMIYDGGDAFRQLFTPAWAGSAAGDHPISAIPPRPGTISSHVAYALAGGFRRFLGSAGVSDKLKTIDSVTPLTFRIVGDGRELWRSAPLQKCGASEPFDVDVSGVRTLHLLTDCPGTNDAAWTVWVGPRLVPAEGGATPVAVAESPADGAYLTTLRPQEIVAKDPFTNQAYAVDALGNSPIFDIKWAGSLPAEHAIWAGPLPERTPSHVAFRLQGGCRRLTGRAAMSDLTSGGATPVAFRVVGDGRELWRSKYLQGRGESEPFDVDVTGVDNLELFVDCPGSEYGAWAVWLDPRVTPAPPALPPQPTDLLALIDPGRDAVQGTWKLEDGALLSPTNPKHADRLQLPGEIPPDYRLEMALTRVRGAGVLLITLPLAESTLYCCIDQYNGQASGLGLIDGKDVRDNETAHRGRVIRGNQAVELSIEVRGRRVQVVVDGKKIVDWTGDPARASLVPNWAGRDRRSFTMGVDNSAFRFTRIALTPLAAEGSAAQ